MTPDGSPVIDDPEVRHRLIKAIDSYTQIYRKGCHPTRSVTWDRYGNNAQFLAQSVVMTTQTDALYVNGLKRERPEDYYSNAVTIDSPAGAYGQPLVIETFVNRAAVFKDGEHRDREGVRAFPCPRGLARALPQTSPASACCRRCRSCLRLPFWLDPGDPHRMRSVMQLLTQPRSLRLRGRFWRLAAQ